MDNTRPVRTNTADRAAFVLMTQGTCAYLFARFVLSGTFIPTRYIPVHIELKQHITVTVDTLNNDPNYELLGK